LFSKAETFSRGGDLHLKRGRKGNEETNELREHPERGGRALNGASQVKTAKERT